MDISKVNRNEIYRYMGCKGEADPAVRRLAQESLEQLDGVCRPGYVVREFPLRLLPDGRILGGCFETRSKSLYRNLKDCRQVLVFAATLGIGPDQLIRRYSRLEMSRALALQAASAAMIESYCNQVCAKLKQEYRDRGLYLRPRYSPGYGDFPLECQPKILAALDAGRRIGIKLTDSMLMMPSKSVSAVMGISTVPDSCRVQGCEACEKIDCIYRR